MTIHNYQRAIGDWHIETFGKEVSANRMARKWDEESTELANAILANADKSDIGEEIADCFIMLCAIADRNGIRFSDAVAAKFDIVKSRDQLARDRERGIL